MSIKNNEKFYQRHLGFNNEQNDSELEEMLKIIQVSSIEQLIRETIPNDILLNAEIDIPEALTEEEVSEKIEKIASQNKIYKSYIGLGYYNTKMPAVITRNILENPGWYTSYTPYQAEVSQGRLEALLNFQTVISDLTGFEIANASLLDEATATVEAMLMFYRMRKKEKKHADIFLVSEKVFPQTKDLLLIRAKNVNIKIQFFNTDNFSFSEENTKNAFGIIFQYPASDGSIINYSEIIKTVKKQNISVVLAADIMSLLLLKSPADLGADAAVGNSQRFGVPMGYGGPHAAYMSCTKEFLRQMPGRIIGISKDSQDKEAYRMVLQTREQHIRREKATSNICTAQALLATLAGMYCVYHGPQKLKKIATRIHLQAVYLEDRLNQLGLEQLNENYFDTLKILLNDGFNLSKLKSLSEKANVNLRFFSDDNTVNSIIIKEESSFVGISIDETTTNEDINTIEKIFMEWMNISPKVEINETIASIKLKEELLRKDDYLTHEVFHKYHSETEILRYMKRLENKDISLAQSMIALGSCTMKLNNTVSMQALSYSSVANLHPFIPKEQAMGYHEMIDNFEALLCKITGFDGCTFQPNSGAQGEYTGLAIIRQYFKKKQDSSQIKRNIVLIPSSAHGTNPASAVSAGFIPVIVKCNEMGNIDINDLEEKAIQYKNELAAFMVTYPSTHGVFEIEIKKMCDIIHSNGGQVYMDGANMNAQVGYTSPNKIGADVCHLNLHKTFGIPHGGGGPGVGPVLMKSHLVEFMPGHLFQGNVDDSSQSEKPIRKGQVVAASLYGSASVLWISYAYVLLLGKTGLKKATEGAILNANYMKSRLEKEFTILYSGANNRCAHEFIVDFRMFQKTSSVTVEDVSKRLMDYGFHAPTVSFPVPGTLMIEPTESESKAELDKFCDAMFSIKKEIIEIEENKYDKKNNVLKNSPHSADVLISQNSDFPYENMKAAYPIESLKENKYWPPVNRIDNPYGDRNLKTIR